MLFTSALLLPWIIALVSTPLAIRWALARGWLDHPDARKQHARPVPVLGGVVVFGAAALGLAATVLLAPPPKPDLFALDPGSFAALGAGIGAMVMLGLLDDRVDLRAPVKFASQLAVAAATWFMGFRIGAVELPLGWVIADATVPSLLLTVGWIVVVTNAFNLIDGVDGLATGVGIITGLTLYVLATGHRETVPIIAALAVTGALAGFLRYNLPPARIFLGDAGALGIGYAAAVLSVATYQKSSTAMVVAVPLVALALPILDVLLAVARRGLAHLRERGLRGLRPAGVIRAVTSADRGHIHDLLLRSGWSVRRILVSMYLVSVLFAAAALWTRNLGSSVRWWIAAATIGAGFVALRLLARRVQRLEHVAQSRRQRGVGLGSSEPGVARRV